DLRHADPRRRQRQAGHRHQARQGHRLRRDRERAVLSGQLPHAVCGRPGSGDQADRRVEGGRRRRRALGIWQKKERAMTGLELAKYAGLFVSTVLGAIGLFINFKDESGRVTGWAYFALILILLGAAIGSYAEYAQLQEEKARAQEQIAKSNRLLADV